jgi:hypothetical protein
MAAPVRSSLFLPWSISDSLGGVGNSTTSAGASTVRAHLEQSLPLCVHVLTEIKFVVRSRPRRARVSLWPCSRENGGAAGELRGKSSSRWKLETWRRELHRRGQREGAEAGRPGARAREEPREAKAGGEASARSRPCGGDGAVDPQLLPEKWLVSFQRGISHVYTPRTQGRRRSSVETVSLFLTLSYH